MKYNYWKLVSALAVIAVLVSGCGCKSAGQSSGIPPSQNASPTQAAAQTDSPPLSTTGSATQNTDQPASTPAGETAIPAETPVAVSSESPLAPEKNPPGDIPDTQAFVKYINATGGYELQSPEGWARTENGTSVSFVDKFDGVQVTVSQSSDQFTVDNIKANQVAELQKTGRAIKIKNVAAKQTKSGQAIVITYESNSEPDAVTGKQVRLEDECFYFFKDGKLAALTMWAPLGADNVDQWKFMSDSFRWN